MIKPWGTRVAVSDPPASPQDGTYSGIHLPPGTGLEMICRGIVEGIGEEVRGPAGFTTGAVVFYLANDGLELGRDLTLKIIDQRQILAWEEA